LAIDREEGERPADQIDDGLDAGLTLMERGFTGGSLTEGALDDPRESLDPVEEALDHVDILDSVLRR
jgi:hypothetical protein